MEDQGWAHAESERLLTEIPITRLKVIAMKAKKSSSPLLLGGVPIQ